LKVATSAANPRATLHWRDSFGLEKFSLRAPMLAIRSRMAWHRNLFYVRSQKLLALLASRGSKKILLSGTPDWIDDIKRGFQRLPHQVEHGDITEESVQHYDVVVPLSLYALQEARRCCSPKQNALPLPSVESVRLCDDKYEFNQALVQAGFSRHIPRMGLGAALQMPYILKKRIGWWGTGCYIIRSRADEQAHLARINDPEYFCQEFITGPVEFATHILFVGDKIVKALNIKYEAANDLAIKGQDPFLYRVIHRCPYLKLFTRILRTIHFEGLCCVNYKVANGEPFVLEINPRFGGSLAPFFFSFVRHLR
jgi:predicted ATP-grasp superfamily ATP-dependent carboligase